MDVRLPNGTILRNVPEGTSKDEIRIKAIRNGLAKPEDFGDDPNSAAWQIPRELDEAAKAVKPRDPNQRSSPSVLDYFFQGAAAVPIMAAVGRAGQALTAGSKVAPYGARLAEAVIPTSGRGLIYEGALGGAAGVTGGLAAEQAPEGFQTAASIITGVATGAAFSPVKNAFDLWASRSLTGEATEAGRQMAKTFGEAKASAQAMTAIKANPDLVPTVLRASEIEQRTGISLPVLAASNGDTTISSYLQSQMARGENAEFAAALRAQYEAAEKALTAARNGKAPTMQEVDTYVKRQAAKVAAENKAIAERAAALDVRRQRGIEAIDDRIASITADISAPGRQDVGTRLTSLIKAKEDTIRGQLSPLYDELITKSMEAGIVLPGSSAKGLRDFATDEMNFDVFGKFPSLYRQIVSVFRTPTASEGTKAAGKYKFAKTAAEQKDIPLNQLDSLKREVNAALRDTTDKDQIRKLVELKKQVDAAIDTVDPAFSVPYREIDKQYAMRLGQPFSEKGIIDIDRARFVEDAVPKMTKNASTLQQTLAIIGDSPEGKQIVEDAFMFDLSNSKGIINTNTGQLNVAALNRWMKDNKERVDLVPGLRQKLEGLRDNVNVLRENRTRILEARKQAQVEKVENLWSQAYGTSGGLQGIVKRALSNQQDLDRLVNIAGQDKVAKEGIKAAMLDDILAAPGDRLELFNNNKEAFSKIFGKQETENIGFLVEASQRLRDNPFALRINLNTINKTTYEEIFGSKPETTLGEFRNQILSAPRVFINHISRYFQNRANKDEAAEVQRFLLDPKNLQLTAEMVRELETKGITDKTLAIMKTMVKNYQSNMLFGGLTGAITGSQAQPAEPYQPSDPSMLRGFGVSPLQ